MTRPMRVIADDLSGAADTGIAFAGSCTPADLVLDRVQARWDHSWLTIIDTDTRDAAPLAAAAIIHAVARNIRESDHVFKKIDSALRGNAGVELGALRESLSDRTVLVAPAIPAAGRVTLGGIQRVHGVPLHAAQVWIDQAGDPPPTVAVALHEPDARVLGLNVIRSPDLPQRIACAVGKVAICDAQTESDLLAIARAGLSAPCPILWVGASGLARALASQMLPPRAPPVVPSVPTALVVIGSPTGMARSQAQALALAGADWVTVEKSDLLSMTVAEAMRLSRDLAQRAAARTTVISVTGDVNAAARSDVHQALARITGPAAAQAGLLVLLGGATARAVLAYQGAQSLRLICDLGEGAVLGRIRTVQPTYVITKSGSLGDELALVRLLSIVTTLKGKE